MYVFQFYVGEIDQPGVVSTVARSYKTLLGAPSPPRRHPPSSDDAVLTVFIYVPQIRNADESFCAPSPLGDRWLHDTPTLLSVYVAQSPFQSKFVCTQTFRTKQILAKKAGPYILSAGIFLDFSTFKPKKIRPEKFRGKNDPGVRTFKPEIVGRKNIRTVRAGHDRPDHFPGVHHLSVVRHAVMRGFSSIRIDLFGNSGRESSYTEKISNMKRIRPEKRGG